MGPVINPPAITALYATRLEQQPRDGVVYTQDLAYCPDERHKLDLLAPEVAPAQPVPVVIFTQGGGFIRGDKSGRENEGVFLARQSMLALVPSYRLAPQHLWPAGPEDVVLALRWAQAHGASKGGDFRRVVLIGESAGAAQIAAAMLLKRFHPEGGLGAAGAILISGGYNAQLEWLARHLLCIASPDPRNVAISNVSQIDAPEIPLLITYAELDPIQQQVQAGELFSNLWMKHGFHPAIQTIRHHNHLSQIHAINTGGPGLGQVMFDFVNALSVPGTPP